MPMEKVDVMELGAAVDYDRPLLDGERKSDRRLAWTFCGGISAVAITVVGLLAATHTIGSPLRLPAYAPMIPGESVMPSSGARAPAVNSQPMGPAPKAGPTTDGPEAAAASARGTAGDASANGDAPFIPGQPLMNANAYAPFIPDSTPQSQPTEPKVAVPTMTAKGSGVEAAMHQAVAANGYAPFIPGQPFLHANAYAPFIPNSQPTEQPTVKPKTAVPTTTAKGPDVEAVPAVAANGYAPFIPGRLGSLVTGSRGQAGSQTRS
jgi:hypothetical protein